MIKKLLMLLCAVVLAGCTSQSAPSESVMAVPIIQEEDIIRTFYGLINEKQIGEAIGMMSESLVGDESQKQAWGVQFNAMKSVSVAAAEKSLSSEWTEDRHTYTVTLDLVMDPASSDEPIPYYGYQDGESIRWVTIQKINNQWKVADIATGP